MDLTNYFLLLYVVPTVICIILLYLDEDVKIMKDYLEDLWICFIPIMNIVLILMVLVSSLIKNLKFSERWQKFLNTKIK